MVIVKLTATEKWEKKFQKWPKSTLDVDGFKDQMNTETNKN